MCLAAPDFKLMFNTDVPRSFQISKVHTGHALMLHIYFHHFKAPGLNPGHSAFKVMYLPTYIGTYQQSIN